MNEESRPWGWAVAAVLLLMLALMPIRSYAAVPDTVIPVQRHQRFRPLRSRCAEHRAVSIQAGAVHRRQGKLCQHLFQLVQLRSPGRSQPVGTGANPDGIAFLQHGFTFFVSIKEKHRQAAVQKKSPRRDRNYGLPQQFLIPKWITRQIRT